MWRRCLWKKGEKILRNGKKLSKGAGLHEAGLHEAGLHEAGLHEGGLASQRKMSEQRRVLAGLGEDVERKKEVRKLLSKMFRSAHCPAFSSNCHNFSCLG